MVPEKTKGPKDKEERQHSRIEEIVGQSPAIGDVSREDSIQANSVWCPSVLIG